MFHLYPKPHTLNPKKGFTLIELLVVITIITIISSIGMVMYREGQKAARDTKRKQDLRSIAAALEIFYQKNGLYANTSGTWLLSNTASQPWMSELTTTYLNNLPVDPINSASCSGPWSGCFVYAYQSGDFGGGSPPAYPGCPAGLGQYYALVARLENTNDPEVNSNKHYKWCDGQDTSTWAGWSYTFVVTSQD